MLEPEEEALNEVAVAVERVVTMDLRRCYSGWNHGDGPLFGDGIAQRFCIVAFVAQDVLGGQIFDQSFGLRDVADLPRR